MSAELQIDNRCHFTSASGRRCRMLRTNGHASLCSQHLRRELQPAPQPAPELVAAELLGPIQDFTTATAINQVLGRLLALLAAQRIPPRNAAILAYICQLLLTTLPAMESEITCAKGYPGWEHLLRQALRSLRNSKSAGLGEAALKRATEAHRDTSRSAS